MIADKIAARFGFNGLRRLFAFFILLLHAVGLFLPGFGVRRSECKLYLSLQRRDVCFQRFQFILFFPYSADRFLQNRNIPLIGYILRLVLLHELGYALQRVQKVHRILLFCSNRPTSEERLFPVRARLLRVTQKVSSNLEHTLLCSDEHKALRAV